MRPDVHPAVVRLTLVLPLLAVLAGSAAAQTPREACLEACQSRNLDASCAWLTMQPRRCRAHALQECRDLVRDGAPAACPLPPDLPPCLTNQGCPFGALCVDSTCQVVGCDEAEGFPPCPGHQRCVEGRCIVDDCQQSNQNCPAGSHCTATDLVSGLCEADDPTRVACTSDTDCIASGSFNPHCMRGVCAARRRRRRCESESDCFAACRTSQAAARISRCNAAGQCVCANCTDDAQCDARFRCADDQAPVCRTAGPCACPPPVPSGGGGSGTGVCTSFEMPPCTPCRTDADCGGGFDVCIQSGSCEQTGGAE
jgi:hypothetical protein